MTRSKNEYAPEQRLKQLGFSDEDLKRISAYGWTADYAVAEVERLLYTGLTTEAYARETFAEAYPEIFDGCLTVVDEKQPTLKYNKSDKLKCEITNFVEIMRTMNAIPGSSTTRCRDAQRYTPSRTAS